MTAPSHDGAGSPPRAAFPIVVHTLIVQARTIVLLRRVGTGFLDGYWGPPGGHLERGELPTAAAERECFEECGLEVDAPTPLAVLPWVTRRTQGINLVFRATRWAGELRVAEPETSDAVEFCAFDALPEPRVPWLDAALGALEQPGITYEEFDWD